MIATPPAAPNPPASPALRPKAVAIVGTSNSGKTELICRFTPGGRLSFVNDAYCRYFSLDKERCLGEHHPVLLVPDDVFRMKEHLAALTPESPVALIEHRILLPGGTVRWHRWNDRAIFGKDGRVIEYQSVGRDITEHRQAEEALKESEEQYRFLLNNTSEFNPITGFNCRKYRVRFH